MSRMLTISVVVSMLACSFPRGSESVHFGTAPRIAVCSIPHEEQT